MTVILDEIPTLYSFTCIVVYGIGLVQDIKYESTELFGSSNYMHFYTISGISTIIYHTAYISHSKYS